MQVKTIESSGRGKNDAGMKSLYKDMTTYLEVHITLSDQLQDYIQLKFLIHGQWRDVYEGVSKTFGDVIVKFHPKHVCQSNENDNKLYDRGMQYHLMGLSDRKTSYRPNRRRPSAAQCRCGELPKTGLI